MIITKGARQPNAFPSIMPSGTPSTSEPLTPIKMTPMALALNSSLAILEAIVIDNTVISALLAADKIRATTIVAKLGLTIDRTFPAIKTRSAH